MCGICGIIHDDHSHPVERHILETMNCTMEARGPDDEGYFLGNGAALAIRRLSIIDVNGGHQPMSSEDGKIYSVCNGEIYNYKEIRAELKNKGHHFLTRSDVEILPHLYEEHGAGFLSKLNGMFGLAVWDEKNRALLLARDRMGEKPLYWTYQNGIFVFGSELKAVLAHPLIESTLDHASLSKYLAYEYIPAPHTIIKSVHKLEPGQLLIFRDGNITTRFYWNLPVRYEDAAISEEDAVAEITRLLHNSVKGRMISDVPLGVFLSGGIDSSVVASTMAKIVEPRNIKTFSVAFADKSFDESSYAKGVATFLGTDHREFTCTPGHLIDLLPSIVDFLDEPLGDASIIPTFALSKFARQDVTVALGGDGGDELFAGYPTFQAEKIFKFYKFLPRFVENNLIKPLVNILPSSDDNMSWDFKLKQFLKGARYELPLRHWAWSGSFTLDEQRNLLESPPSEDLYCDVNKHAHAARHLTVGNRLLYLYSKLYLAEDVLTKVDRASMAASLEVRAPFLDHELVEFVAYLPYRMKLRGFKTKYILKRAFKNSLPQNILNRPKKGFGIPVAKWIKGPLKKNMLDVFDLERIKTKGIFKPRAISVLLKDHFSGKVDNRKKLWTLFMFEQWLERWG